MARLKKEMITFLTEEQINGLVQSIATELERDYLGKKVVMVCPLKGSVLFFADLLRLLPTEMKIQTEFVHLTDTEKKGSIEIHKDISLNIKGRHVIIVEEIIDVGRTLSFLRDRILSSDPASVKIVALLDKPARRELPIRPDYVGMTIDDRYVVGYGMDSEEVGRNYKEIMNFSM